MKLPDISAIWIYILLLIFLAILIRIFLHYRKYLLQQNNEENQFTDDTNTPQNTEDEAIIKGEIGEAKVNEILQQTTSQYRHIINDFLFVTPNGKSCQIDHILINEHGIFVIETKNYSGNIYGYENQKDWYQYLKNGTRYTHTNPLKQNAIHVYNLKQIIGNDYPFISLVVFVQNNAPNKPKIENVINLSSLKSNIESYATSVLSHEQINEIYESLINYQSENSLTKEQHLRNINETQSNIKDNICPRCGSEIIEKQGQYGSFWACSNYPTCHFVKGKTENNTPAKNISADSIDEKASITSTISVPVNPPTSTETIAPITITPRTSEENPEPNNANIKDLTCKLCGSSNFSQIEDYIVCNSCGLKISKSEAQDTITKNQQLADEKRRKRKVNFQIGIVAIIAIVIIALTFYICLK